MPKGPKRQTKTTEGKKARDVGPGDYSISYGGVVKVERVTRLLVTFDSNAKIFYDEDGEFR